MGEGLQVGLLAHAQVHQLLGLRLGGLLGAHFHDVVQSLQFAQRIPLGQEGEGFEPQSRPGGSEGQGQPAGEPGGAGAHLSLTCFISTFMWWVLPLQ